MAIEIVDLPIQKWWIVPLFFCISVPMGYPSAPMCGSFPWCRTPYKPTMEPRREITAHRPSKIDHQHQFGTGLTTKK